MPISTISPMLCQPSPPFNSSEFMFEVKWDGERAVMLFENGKLTIQNRKGIEVTYRYPELQNIKFNCPCVIDGEVIVLDENGRSDFNLIAKRSHLEKKFDIELRMQKIPVTFMAFDILSFDGRDVTMLPLYERRSWLYKAMQVNGVAKWSLPLDKEGNGKALFESAVKQGLEGIVAKYIDSPYTQGKRSPHWKKIKNEKTIDMIFNRYEVNNAGIKLQNDERFTVQCTGEQSKAVKKAIDDNGRAMVEVKYLNVTPDGRLRMPTFKGLKA